VYFSMSCENEGGGGRIRSEGKGGEGGEHLLLGLGCAMLA
jgi:hypothetical protein